MKLIGITGKAGSGKDTVCEWLTSEENYERVAFADPLKKAAMEMFGLSYSQCYDPKEKEIVLPFWGRSPRELLQLLGTEGGRNVFGADLWIKRAAVSVNKYHDSGVPGVCISDCRFPNEAEFILQSGGGIIEIVRPGLKEVGVVKHASEAGLPKEMIGYTIVNDGELHDLYFKVDALIERIHADSIRFRYKPDSFSQ